MGRWNLTIAERFWAKTEKIPFHDCWEWVGPRLPRGYGYMFDPTGKGQKTYAHRFAYFLANGPIAGGLSVLHRCDNPSCVRPDHLFLGTQAENLADMDAKGRRRHRAMLGEDNATSKLTVDSVLMVRQSDASGASLARLLGVTKECVYAIRKRRTWAHLD